MTVPRILLFFIAGATAAQAAEPDALDALIKDALAHNPEIRAAQKRVEAARQRPAQQTALPDPMVSFGWQSSGNPLPGAGLGREPTANIGLMYSQELPAASKRRLRGQVASREADAEFEQYQLVARNVVARLKTAWHQIHHAVEMDEILNRNRTVLDNLLKITEARYSVGRAPQADVLRTQTQITILETRRVQYQRDLRVREAEMRALLDLAPGSPVPHPTEGPEPQLTVTLDTLLARAQDEAPALRKEQRMVQRAETALSLAHHEYAPDVTLSGGYYSMGSMPSMYMFRSDIRLPVFTSRRQRAGVAEQVESLAESRQNYQAARRSLEARIEESFAAAETAGRLMRLYRDTALPQAEATLESTLASYQTGAVDFTAVFNTQMALLDYEMSYHEARNDFYLAMIRLEEMTGLELVN
jgi:outer membrane protein, heavy metal efflux system